MKKRVLAAIMAAMMVVLTAGGCGDGSGSDSDSNKSSDQKTNDKKTVTVVTAGTGEPYSLLADDGSWTGIDSDMWAEIEERTGWNVEVKQAAFDAMWGELDRRCCKLYSCDRRKNGEI